MVTCSKYNLHTGAPLSEQQLNIYLDIKANNIIESYLIPLDINLDKYDITQIKNALIKMSDIHPILKSYITIKDNDPWLSIGDTPKLIIVDNIDEYNLKQYLCKPFDMGKNLSRYLFNKQNKTLYTVFHHIIFDGMSKSVFKKDLINILEGAQANYTDTSFLLSSAYSYEIKNTDLYKKAFTFFEREFCDSENLTEPIPDIGDNKPSYNVIELTHNKKQIDSFIKKHKITRGILYTSVFAYMLSRFTNTSKSYFSMIENGRDRFEAGDSIGMFVNTLPIIIDCADTSISSFIDSAQNKIYKTTKYNFYPYRLLANKYSIKNNIVFQYQPSVLIGASNKKTDLSGSLPTENIKTRKDLIADLSFVATDNTVSVTSSSKYSSATTKRMLETYKRILDDLLVKNKLSDINYIIKNDLKLVHKINKTEKELKYSDILEAFKESTEKYPDKKLVTCENVSYTYREASKVVSTIANILKDLDVQANSKIAILVQRSHWYLLCALGILTNGCAYVPIDDTYPDERIAFMLKDTNADSVLVTNETIKRAKKIVKENNIQTILINVDEIDCSKNIVNYTYMQVNESDIACILYTSGTTGKPKGTLITRKAILNFSQWDVFYTNAKTSDVFGLYSSFGFDAHIKPFYSSIFVGATLSIIPENIKLNMNELNNYVMQQNITHLFLTTKVGFAFVSDISLTKLEHLFIGGEANGSFRGSSICNMYQPYGPTENTVFSTVVPFKKMIDDISIGSLLPNIKAYILDKEKRQVPFGAIGELYLSGYQLAKGYLNRKKETEEVFLSNPFDSDKSGYERMYKTGDIIRYLPDGTLGFIGRADNQVKIRGNRVELGEVETCIREVSVIKDVTVQTITNNNNKELVAYVVADNHEKSDVNIKDLIKKHVSNTKPDYMLPTHIVMLDKIPLNINGKVDVRALPKPDITKSKTEYVTPTNEIERKICNAFSQVFNIEKVGIEDDFITLGGDSLSAIHLLSILKDYNFTVANILSSGIPKKLAKIYKTNKVNKLRNIKFSLDEGVALSNTQTNVYLDQKINSKYNTYKIINVIKIEKQFSLSDIKIALDKLIDAYPILFTKVEDRSDGAYLVKGKHPLVNFITDYKKLDLDFKLDPNKGPLSVFNIVKHKNLYYLYYIIHHLIFDGKSVDILNNTFNKLLKDNIKLNKDYSFIRASEIDASIRDTDIQAKHIKAFDKIFNHVDSIAYIYPQETGYVSYINKNIDIDITLFRQFIKDNKITEAIFFEAVFGLVYSNFTYSNTPVFCITDNGRDLVDSNRSIGMYVKNIPIALSIKNTSIKDYIKHVFDIIMLARESSTLPFYEYKNRYNVDASVIFQYFSDYIQVLNSSNQLSQDKDIFDNSNKSIDTIADIDCYLYKHDNNFSIKISHSNKYDDRLVESLANTFELVVNEVLTKQNISEIDYADSQTLSLYDKHNQTETALRYRDILEAFLDNTHKHPNNICLVYSEKKYTYKQVDAITNGLAQKLKDKGVKKQDRIAIHVDISEHYLIASLAILKLNATYIPINTNYPLTYKQTLINESKTKLIITTKNTTFDIADIIQIKVDDIKPQECFKCSEYQPKDIACVIFTSGTTGTPKGAKITRIGCANLCDWQSTYINLNKKDVFGMYQNFSFVSHIDPLFSSLFVGAAINIIPNEVKQDIHKLNNYCITHNITAMKMGASIGRLFVEHIKNTTLRVIFLGGEKLGNIETNRKYQIIDGYGPTENTAQTTAIYLIDKSSIDSIGYPIFNNKVYVLNKFNKRLPLYATGKIYASGLGLSEGYINNNTQNKKVFIANIFSDDKSYKTLYDIGDLVRYSSDASISYIGRADKQIQIRGNRVELGEVEACIREISEIQDVTVQTITNNNNKELVAYVVADKHDKSDVNIKDLIKKHVSNTKPDYMIPTHVVVLNRIPLNINGKVDVRALPKPDITKSKTEYIAPTNDIELAICNAFSQVFNIDKIGIEDDFIALGGDSLSAIRILSILKDYQLQATDITILKTPKKIAKKIQKSNIVNLDLNKYTLDTGAPLSEQQLNIYLDIKANNKIESYLIPLCVNLDKYDITQIKNALIKMSDIHPILNSYITIKDNDPWLSIGDSPKLTIVDNIDKYKLKQYLSKPFEMDKNLSRYLFNKQNKTLYAVFHHIIFDGMSSTVFKKDLLNILEGTQVNYTDTTFLLSSAYSYEIKNTDLYRKASTFFEKEFCDSENLTEPIHDIGDNKPSYNVIELNHNKIQIDSFIKKHKITRGILYTSVFAYMLSRFTNSSKSYFSMIENGRDRLEADSSIGMFVNTLPIIIDCADTSISSFLDSAQNKIHKTTKYNFYPYRLLANKYSIKNNIVFQYQPNAMLEYSNTQTNENGFLYSVDIKTRTDLISDLSFVATDDTVSVTSSSKYSSATTKRMLETYKRIFDDLLVKDKLSDINFTTKSDLKLVHEINKTEKALKYNDILEAFKESTEKYPDKKLITYENVSYTYSEGSKVVSTIANILKDLDVQAKSKIAIFVQRSHWYLLCALGILTNGCAYVPIDDSFPNERIAFMLKDTSADAVLATNETINRAIQIVKENSIKTKIINVEEIDYSNDRDSYTYTHVNKSDIACILYTSGTTGKPKGALITRRAILNFSLSYINYMNMSNKDIYSMYTVSTFDMHVVGYYPSLIVGATLNIIPDNLRLNLETLSAHLNKTNTTHITLPTKIAKLLLKINKIKTVKTLVIGGDKLGKIDIQKNMDIFDGYGPTETLAHIASIKAKDKIDLSSVGSLSYNTKVYILDKELRLVPYGAQGELYLSGYQLSKGYLNRNNETKKSFIKNPFDGDVQGYEMMYKTGDIVRYLPDKTLGFIGRVDKQVKIKGNRVELSEVEACIREISEIKDVTVQIIINNNNKELVAYVVADKHDKSEVNIKDLIKKHVSNTKPDYMVPAYVVVLDKIPLNINGKVDVRALPKPDITKSKTEYVAPTNEIERKICNAFSQVFNIEKIGIKDDFIALGGDSLSAIRMLSILKDYQLQATDITRLKTPKQIAKQIQENNVVNLDLKKYTLDTGAPLSEQQLNIYLDIKANNKIESYLIPLCVNLDKYNITQIKNALIKMSNIHPILKSYITIKDNDPWLSIGDNPKLIIVDNIDKYELSQYLSKPFDIDKNLSRYLFNKQNKTLFAVFHHIIFDGMSSTIFIKDLTSILGGTHSNDIDTSFLLSSAYSYEIKNTDLYRKASKFYEKEFCDSESLTEPIPDIGDNTPSYNLLNLNTNKEKIDSFIKKHKITRGILYTSVFAYMLSRYTNSNKSYFSYIENGRDRLDVNDSIGMFANTLPIIIDCTDTSISSFIESAQNKIYKTTKYNFYPYRLLANKFNIKNNIDFQYQPNTMLEYSNTETNENGFLFSEDIKTRTDLISDLSFVATDSTLSVTSSSKYSSVTTKRMLETYKRVLDDLLAKNNLSDINYTINSDLKLIQDINKTEKELKYNDILEAFKYSIEKYPDKKLVTYEDTSYTYSEAAIVISTIADKLKELDVKTRANVAIFVPRSHWYLLCALGILTTSCAYVPIDDNFPNKRIAFMLKDTSADAVLATNETINRIKQIVKENSIKTKIINVDEIDYSNDRDSYTYTHVNKSDIACILYTSGTTGVPKGTLITRKAILNLSLCYIDYMHMSNKDIYSMYTVSTFDMHVVGYYPILIVGATLNIIPDDLRLNLETLSMHLNKTNTTHITLPTKIAKLLLKINKLNTVNTLLAGGDKLGKIDIQINMDIFDGYGPTETLAYISSIKAKNKNDLSSVGTLSYNTKAYILDKELRPVPYGAQGELYLSGYQLAKGYLSRDKETNTSFIENPFDGDIQGYEMMYKTGDIVRYLPDGTLGFIGRADSQVKIRGNRVELGEVEACVREISEIQDVTVQTITNNNNKELVAYVVADKHDKSDINIKDLIKKHVSNTKPDYMIPTHVLVLDKIPLNINGKVDVRALPKPDITKLRIKYMAPTNDTERTVCNAFSQVFNVDKVGVSDDFNLLGGDSIKAIRLVSILNDKNLHIEASNILNLKTPKNIANILKVTHKKIYKPTSGSIGLLPIQKYFFDKINTDSFNQFYIVKANKDLNLDKLQTALNKLTNIQDILRAKYTNNKQIIQKIDTQIVAIKSITTTKSINTILKEEIKKSINNLNLDNDYLIDIKLINKRYITLVIHHLLIDGVSWSIFLDNLANLYNNKLVVRPYPYVKYIKDIKAYSKTITSSTIDKYKNITDKVDENKICGHPFSFSSILKSSYKTNNPYNLTEHEYLLLAISRAYKKTYNKNIIYGMESFGRDEKIANVNKTIGWFTTIYPQEVKSTDKDDQASIIKDIFEIKKSTLSNKHLGIDYLCICYYLKALKFKHMPVIFNFLSDEFSYSNDLFNTIIYKQKQKLTTGHIDKTRNTYGISLNIQKNNNAYTISGECAYNTYLSDRYTVFLNNIEKEVELIDRILTNNTYIYPLYEEQLGVYLDEKINKKDVAYSCFGYVEVYKSLNTNQIKDRINTLINNHPVLKTRIIDIDGTPYGITDSKPIIKIINKSIDAVDKNDLIKPFELNKSLSRFYIIKDKNKNIIAYDMHHIISDATSRILINSELTHNTTKNIDLGFVKKTNQCISERYSDKYNQAKDFWEREFCDETNITEPIYDINNEYGGCAIAYLGDIKNKLINLSNKLSITPNQILTSSFAYTLSRFTYSSKTYFTFTNHGRDLDNLDKALGMYVRTIPIVLHTKDRSINMFLKETSKHILDTMKYSIFPFRLLAKKYDINQNISFEYNSNLNDVSNMDKININYIKDKVKRTSHVSNLLGAINDCNDGYILTIEHSYKYSQNTVVRFVETFKRVLDELLIKDKLSEIDYTTKDDINLFKQINKTETPLKYKDILEAYNKSLSKYPNNVLVSYKDVKYTYAQSSAWIHTLLKQLKDIPKNTSIAILVPRSHYYLLTALAVLAHGCAYVPIDDSFPNERIAFMLKDTSADAVLATNETINRVKQIVKENSIKTKIINVEEIDYSNDRDSYTYTHVNKSDIACILYTSGTTGIPKGTLITRMAILNLSLCYIDYMNMSNKDIYSMYTVSTFDMHVVGYYPILIVGATLNIIPDDLRLNLETLSMHLNKTNTTHITLPTKIAKILLKINKLNTVNTLLAGGDKLGKIDIQINMDIFDGYGPTETLAYISSIKAKNKNDLSSVGTLSYNTKAYILDKELRLVPYGAQGELYLSGYQLAKGYLNRDKETNTSFIKNPFDGDIQGYEMMYKTGDIVRYLPDGTLGFIGRVDSQVKIRGNRVELGEVEACIREISEIQDVTVQAIINNNNKELIAYVVADKHDKSEVNIKDLITKHVSNTKPDYMIPAHVVALDKIPLNINGKVDVRALPKPDITKSKTEYIAPTNDIELAICNTFSQVFNIDKIGIEDDFIALGGDSLSAIRMLSILKDYQLQATDITSLKTPKQIAKQIQKNNVVNLDLKKYTLDTGAPLSEQQLNIYLDIKANNNIESYLIPLEINLNKYDIRQIKNALIKMSDIHPILNSYITIKENDPWLSIGDIPKLIIVDNIDESKLEQYLSKPFDIDKKLSRYLFNKQNNTLYAVFHHIIFDGMSLTVFKKDLINILEGAQDNYTDTTFLLSSAYSYEIKNTDLYKKASIFFEREFCDSENLTEPIPDIGEHTPSYNLMNLNTNEEKINSFIKKHKITCGILYTSVFAYMLSRFTNSNKSYFSMIENGRDRFEAGDSIGMFVNTLPIIIDCADTSISNFIDSVQNKIYKTTKYNFYPYRILANKFDINNNIEFQYQPNALLEESNTKTNKNISIFTKDIKTRTDLISDLSFVVTDTTISVISSSKYSKETSKNMLQVFNLVLNQIIEKKYLCEINYLDNKEIIKLDNLNNTSYKLKYDSLLQPIESQSKLNPNNNFIKYNNCSYSYKESLDIIKNLSDNLKIKINKYNKVIGVFLERSYKFVFSSIAILNCECIVMPMEEAYPDSRIKFMLQDSKANFVVVSNNTKQRILHIVKNCKELQNIHIFNVDEIHNINKNNNSDLKKINLKNSAYIFYTSGSTGLPKPVIQTHLGILNMTLWQIDLMKIKQSDTYALYPSFGFDSHLQTIFSTLYCGACIDIVPEDIRLNMTKLNEYFVSHNVTLLKITTQVGKLWLSSVEKTSVRIAYFSGEKLGKISNLKNVTVIDGYGPTENTLQTSCIEYKNKIDMSSVGRPNRNIKVYILDKELRRVPCDAIGELYISGYQLAKGYLHRENETKEAFLDNPFDEYKPGYEKMYKTGDIVRYLPDGTLGFIGRIDSQVKIRGNRVELGEVESCIREIAEIQDVTVQAITNNNNKELVAYVVADKHDKSDVNIKDLIKKHVSNAKPDYMVPTHVVVLDKIPLNINGKVDKQGLPKVDILQNKVTYIAPSNNVEKSICEAFAKVFNLDKIGMEDDFVALGGNSLIAIKVMSLLDNVKITVGDILTKRTPRQLYQIHKTSFLSKIYNYQYCKNYKSNIYPLLDSSYMLYTAIKQVGKIAKRLYLFNINFAFSIMNADSKILIRAIKDTLDAHLYLKAVLYNKDGKTYIKRRDYWYPSTKIIKLHKQPSVIFSTRQFKPFDIDKDDLFRIKIYEYKQIFYLYVNWHHILGDGDSVQIFIKDLYLSLNRHCIKKEKFNAYDISLIQQKEIKSERGIKNKKYYDKLLQNREMSDFPNKRFGSYISKFLMLAQIPQKYTSIKNTYLKSKVNSFCDKYKISVSSFFLGSFVYEFINAFNKKNLLIGGTSSKRDNKYVMDVVGCIFGGYAISYKHDSANSYIDTLKNIEINSIDTFSHDLSFYLSGKYMNSRKITYNFRVKDLYNDGLVLDNESDIKSKNSVDIKPLPFINKNIIPFPVYITVDKDKNGNYALTFNYQRVLYSKKMMNRFVANMDALIKNSLNEL